MGKTTKSLVIGVLCVLALLLVIHAAWNWTSSRSLIRLMNEQAREGLPMALKDVVPAPVPAAENAAPLLTKAFEAMYPGTRTTSNCKPAVSAALAYRFPEPGSRFDPGELVVAPAKRADIKGLLANPEVDAVLAMIEQASLRPRCGFDVDYTRGAGILLPHLSDLRRCVRLLALRAYARSGDDPMRALGDVRLALRLSEYLKDEPILISQLVRLACRSTTLTSLRMILAERAATDIPPGPVLALLPQLDAIAVDGNRTFVAALDGERIILGKQTFEGMLRGQVDPQLLESLNASAIWLDLCKTRFGRALVRPLLKMDFRCYMQAMAEYRTRASKPYSETMQLPPVAQGISKSCALTLGLVPTLDKIVQKWAESMAFVNLARAGSRLTLAASGNGRYPATLAGLGVPPPTLKDPFSGKDYLYRPGESAYLLYSVGPDGRDDGGVSQSSSGSTGDLVWAVSKP